MQTLSRQKEKTHTHQRTILLFFWSLSCLSSWLVLRLPVFIHILEYCTGKRWWKCPRKSSNSQVFKLPWGVLFCFLTYVKIAVNEQIVRWKHLGWINYEAANTGIMQLIFTQKHLSVSQCCASTCLVATATIDTYQPMRRPKYFMVSVEKYHLLWPISQFPKLYFASVTTYFSSAILWKDAYTAIYPQDYRS